MEDLLAFLARGLVDDPDEVVVDSFEEDDGTIVLELAVAEGDAGKVIGRGGRTIAALRTVVKASVGAARTGACWSTSSTSRWTRSRLSYAGRVGRPHGLDGSFAVREPRERLEVGTIVTVAGRARAVESAWRAPTSGRW